MHPCCLHGVACHIGSALLSVCSSARGCCCSQACTRCVWDGGCTCSVFHTSVHTLAQDAARRNQHHCNPIAKLCVCTVHVEMRAFGCREFQRQFYIQYCVSAAILCCSAQKQAGMCGAQSLQSGYGSSRWTWTLLRNVTDCLCNQLPARATQTQQLAGDTAAGGRGRGVRAGARGVRVCMGRRFNSTQLPPSQPPHTSSCTHKSRCRADAPANLPAAPTSAAAQSAARCPPLESCPSPPPLHHHS